MVSIAEQKEYKNGFFEPEINKMKELKNNREKHRERALKAWKTMKKRGFVTKRQKKIVYNNKLKENQREIMIKLLKEKLKDFDYKNPLRNKNIMPHGIYLESPELLFTKKISENNLGREVFFYIPNNIEFNKFYFGSPCAGNCQTNMFGETHIQYIPHERGSFYQNIIGVVLVNRTYKEFIEDSFRRENNKWNTIFIWADYCGTFTTYKEDIESTFKQKILGNGSIYALTFCYRDVSKEKKIGKYSKSDYIIAVTHYVQECAEKYGYKAKILPESGLYKKTMYTMIFDITHPQIEEDVEKIIELEKSFHRIADELEYKLDHLKRKY